MLVESVRSTISVFHICDRSMLTQCIPQPLSMGLLCSGRMIPDRRLVRHRDLRAHRGVVLDELDVGGQGRAARQLCHALQQERRHLLAPRHIKIMLAKHACSFDTSKRGRHGGALHLQKIPRSHKAHLAVRWTARMRLCGAPCRLRNDGTSHEVAVVQQAQVCACSHPQACRERHMPAACRSATGRTSEPDTPLDSASCSAAPIARSTTAPSASCSAGIGTPVKAAQPSFRHLSGQITVQCEAPARASTQSKTRAAQNPDRLTHIYDNAAAVGGHSGSSHSAPRAAERSIPFMHILLCGNKIRQEHHTHYQGCKAAKRLASQL